MATRSKNIRERDARVIAAAWRLIAREGLGALTVKALANEAGVAASSMLYTMPNHEVVRERALEVIVPTIRTPHRCAAGAAGRGAGAGIGGVAARRSRGITGCETRPRPRDARVARTLAARGKRGGAGHVEHETWAWAAGGRWAAAHPRQDRGRNAGVRPALPDLRPRGAEPASQAAPRYRGSTPCTRAATSRSSSRAVPQPSAPATWPV